MGSKKSNDKKPAVITEIIQTVYNPDGSVYQQQRREVPDGYEVTEHRHKPQLGWKNEWIALCQRAMMAIVREANLTKNEYKLLLYLMAQAGYHNAIITDLDLLAADLGIAKSNAHTALSGLIRRNIVVLRGRRRNYRQPTDLDLELNVNVLNYNLGWKGNGDEGRQKRGECPPLLRDDGSPLLPASSQQILADRVGAMLDEGTTSPPPVVERMEENPTAE